MYLYYCTFLTKTYEVQDCNLYVDGSSNAHFPTTTSSGGWIGVSTQNEKIAVDNPITLPSAFEISYKGIVANTNSWNILAIGENDSCNNYAFGQFINKGVFLRKGWASPCTSSYLIQESNSFNLNEETLVVYQYNNGVHKLKIGNNEYTATNSDYTPTYFLGIGLPVSSTSKIKELKIKPL